MNDSSKRSRLAAFALVWVALTGLHAQASAGDAKLYKARCVPSFFGGSVEGFKCTEIGDGSFYQKAGLRNGDVVLTMDEVKLEDARTAMTFFGELEKGTVREIVVRRGGEMVTLKVGVN